MDSSPSQTEERDVIVLITTGTLDPLGQDETMIAGQLTRVIARPENQVVGLGVHDQFLVFFH
jgi:hypothetical protein